MDKIIDGKALIILEDEGIKPLFFKPEQGQRLYHMSRSTVFKLARESGCLYKIGRACLINKELFESYMETFKVPEDMEIN